MDSGGSHELRHTALAEYVTTGLGEDGFGRITQRLLAGWTYPLLGFGRGVLFLEEGDGN